MYSEIVRKLSVQIEKENQVAVIWLCNETKLGDYPNKPQLKNLPN